MDFMHATTDYYCSTISSSLPGLLLLLLLAFLACYFLLPSPLRHRNRRCLPPGPAPWPVFGNLLHLLRLNRLPFHRILAQLAPQYGPIFFLRLGTIPTVVISSPLLAKELLHGPHDENFANRPHSRAGSRVVYPEFIALLNYGPAYRRQRKVFVRELALIQEKWVIRVEEISHALQEVQDLSEGGQVPVNLTRLIDRIHENLFSRFVFGTKVRESELGNNSLQHIIREITDALGLRELGDYIPYLGWLDVSSKRKTNHIHKLIDSYIDTVMADRRLNQLATNKLQSGDGAAARTNFLDELMLSDEFTDSSIKATVWGMLTAGIDPSSATVDWAMAELLRNPIVLQKLQEEIKSKITDDEHLADESDIAKLDYLHAVINETFRLHPAVPLLLPHMNNEACEIGGYLLPKKTLAIVNVWAIGRSSSLWNDPEEFRPERFIGNGIDPRGQHFELLPFGTGRRMCAGISVGLTMISVILTNLLRTFDWQLPPSVTPSNMDMTESDSTIVWRKHPLILLPKLRLAKIPTTYRDSHVI